MAKSTAKPWHETVRLRGDIRDAELSLKTFVADLHDVMLNRNEGIYHHPDQFFALTYPTVRLRDLARDVTRRLAGKSEKAVRQLHVTFGGGKTHALIALVHLVADPDNLPEIPAVQEFRTHCDLDGPFPQARVAAIVFDRLDAEQGMVAKAPDGTQRALKMPWSLLAWQLAGEAGMRMLKDDGTERQSPPATNVMEELLELAQKDISSVLILFDEVLWFVRTMADQDEGWIRRMADFLHSLTQAVAKVPQCCLVASLLASDNSKLDELGKRISKELYDEFKRVADEGIQPVESQDVPEILRRRLFELESYSDKSHWKQQVMRALNSIGGVDDYTAKNRSDEEDRYLESFPFHPDLVKLFYEKWTQLEGFQQTRGILKTLATALRDAEKWDDQPLVSSQVFLSSPGHDGLSPAARELAGTAQVEQYEGQKQYWPAILESELSHAARAQEGLSSLVGREIEQAVITTFLHSQPIGHKASAREINLLVAGSSPDRIELNKGLGRWADTSWYLDDIETADRENGLPKFWRLGSRPNLKQMHHDARSQIAGVAVEEVLEQELRNIKKLTEGARASGAKPHVLPVRPADIEDDGEFHYAVLGPKSVSESGKPSAEARRFIEDTTSSEKPRARNRNGVVLLVPSREGLDAARDKTRDFLGWEKVRDMLKTRDDIDVTTTARLETNFSAAKSEMVSQVTLAWCIAVTVNETNSIAAYRFSVDNEPVFAKLVGDKRLRIESDAINAEALLPGGPFDFWADGETSRFVKDIVGAFAATAGLPKMLNREAIMETLLQGCEAGDFVLQVTRSDKSRRTFWRSRPDDTALNEPSLEIVLPDAASLTEIEPGLLSPGALPEMWKEEVLTMAALSAFFSGKTLIAVDRGEYQENQLVPGAGDNAIKKAVKLGVQSGQIWLVNGTISVCGEEAPAGFLNENASFHPPPTGASASNLLPDQLVSAWTDNETNAHLIHAALSADAGRPLPWSSVRLALQQGFNLGLFELLPDSGPWPSDLGGASAVKLRLVEGVEEKLPTSDGLKSATADLETHELQDLAEEIDELKELTAGHTLKLKVCLELGESKGVDAPQVEQINAILGNIKSGWEI